MMPCAVICGSMGHTEDVYGHNSLTVKLVGSISMNLGTFFTSAKALHFVIEATLHSKGICIYAYDAFRMPFILTFN